MEAQNGREPGTAMSEQNTPTKPADRFARTITFNLSNAEYQAMRRFSRQQGISLARYAHKAVKAQMVAEGKSND